jgi:hypothetical protein
MRRGVAATVLGLRVAYGCALVAAPRRLTRRWLGPAAEQPGTVVAVRALGIREALLHAGALVAVGTGAPVRPWLGASIAGDLADIASTTAARDGLPQGAAPATATVAGGSALVSAVAAAIVDR